MIPVRHGFHKIFKSLQQEAYMISDHGAFSHDMSYVTTTVASLVLHIVNSIHRSAFEQQQLII